MLWTGFLRTGLLHGKANAYFKNFKFKRKKSSEMLVIYIKINIDNL
jgi:hypothetical protein